MEIRIRKRRNDTPETLQRWKQDMQERKPWLKTRGPITAAGKRRVSANRAVTGLESLEYAAACRYADAVARSLSWVDWV